MECLIFYFFTKNCEKKSIITKKKKILPFFINFRTFLNYLDQQIKTALFEGDIYISFLYPSLGKAFFFINHICILQKLYPKCFIPLITQPTRFPPGNLTSPPSTLDLIWTNYLHTELHGIIDFDATDHLPCFCILDLPVFDNTDVKTKI